MVNTEIRLIILFAAEDGEVLFSQQKQDQELIVAQIMKSSLQNSDLTHPKPAGLSVSLMGNPCSGTHLNCAAQQTCLCQFLNFRYKEEGNLGRC